MAELRVDGAWALHRVAALNACGIPVAGGVYSFSGASD